MTPTIVVVGAWFTLTTSKTEPTLPPSRVICEPTIHEDGAPEFGQPAGTVADVANMASHAVPEHPNTGPSVEEFLARDPDCAAAVTALQELALAHFPEAELGLVVERDYDAADGGSPHLSLTITLAGSNPDREFERLEALRALWWVTDHAAHVDLLLQLI